MVTLGVSADGAGIALRHVATLRAADRVRCRSLDRVGELGGLRIPEDVERQALCRDTPDPREALKRLDELFEGCGERQVSGLLEQPGEIHTPRYLGETLALHLFSAGLCVLKRNKDEVFEGALVPTLEGFL